MSCFEFLFNNIIGFVSLYFLKKKGIDTHDYQKNTPGNCNKCAMTKC